MELVQETNCRAMLDELSTLSDYIRAMRTHYKPQMNGERYYTTEEVCQVLKITKRTLQQYRDDGVIPFVALPGKMLYRESDLRAALEKNYVAPFAHRNAEDFPAVYGRRKQIYTLLYKRELARVLVFVLSVIPEVITLYL